MTDQTPPFRSETTWAARQLVNAAAHSSMTAETADGWVCAAHDTAAVVRTLGTVLGPYHEKLASQCEALADECARAVEHSPISQRTPSNPQTGSTHILGEEETSRIEDDNNPWPPEYTCAGCGRAVPCRRCPDDTPTVGQVLAELVALRAENQRLRDELEIARIPHTAPYVDPLHQGGCCVDAIMAKIGEVMRLQTRIDKALDKLSEWNTHPGRIPANLLDRIARILRGEEDAS